MIRVILFSYYYLYLLLSLLQLKSLMFQNMKMSLYFKSMEKMRGDLINFLNP